MNTKRKKLRKDRLAILLVICAVVITTVGFGIWKITSMLFTDPYEEYKACLLYTSWNRWNHDSLDSDLFFEQADENLCGTSHSVSCHHRDTQHHRAENRREADWVASSAHAFVHVSGSQAVWLSGHFHSSDSHPDSSESKR